ncbi:MAG TPA: hypothetical protein ENH96_05415 [Chlamydiae bacterium]|nr:hypothetical protein [Chlamydiota bacterium]
MKEDFFNKTIRIGSFRQNIKPLRINIRNLGFSHFQDVELKNTVTSSKSTKSYFKDLFFETFPYIDSNAENQTLKKDIPAIFFDSSIFPNELISLNQEPLIKEKSPYIDYLKSLRFFGTLKQRKDKSVYLKIDDSFINLISSKLPSDIEKMSDFNISIISKEEHKKYEVFPIIEQDEKFQYRIKDLYSVNVQTENGFKKVWFLEIESKDLEEFRYKYHLFPKKNGHNFSIKLGSITSFKLKLSYPLMKINRAFFAA